jgi:hypothetical protein
MNRYAVIDTKKLSRDLDRIAANIEKMEETATIRTLNIVATRARAMIANDVYEDTGINKGTAKRRISIYKAKRGKLWAVLFIKAARVTFPQPRMLKEKGRQAGVSFLATGKKRVRKKSPIQMKGIGSKPFLAKLPSGGISGGPKNKKVAVYVRPGYTDKKGSHRKGSKNTHPRRIAALIFSSLPHLARKDWQQKVNALSIKEFRKEYPKQIKKARFKARRK